MTDKSNKVDNLNVVKEKSQKNIIKSILIRKVAQNVLDFEESAEKAEGVTLFKNEANV